MKSIKTREAIEKGIKTIDKTVTWTERVKNPVVYLNQKSKETTGDSTPTEYGEDKIKYYSNRAKDETIHYTNKAVSKGKDKLIKQLNKNKTIKQESKTIKNTTNKIIKNTSKTIKETPKNVERAKKTAQAAKRLAEQSAKATAKAAKVTVKVLVSAVKALIEALSSLIGLIASGGIVAVIVIVVICLIALILCSTFGIFFANENKSMTMSQVITEINKDVNYQMLNEAATNRTADYEINFDDYSWREVIAIYSVKYSADPNNVEPILYLNESNVKKVKQVFWDMNSISKRTETRKVKTSYTDRSGKVVEFYVDRPVLIVDFKSESKESVMDKYKFTDAQKKQVEELLSSKYDDLWMNLIYGSSSGNIALVNTALNEEGYTHGDKYWKWYGFDERVEWCAIFVSWVANELDLLNNTIPKFSGVGTGIDWFKENGRWENKGYSPRPGDIIFFDWEPDGKANHVGIVVNTDGNTINTIEGNSTDDGVRKKSYNINSDVIYGFGVPNYS